MPKEKITMPGPAPTILLTILLLTAGCLGPGLPEQQVSTPVPALVTGTPVMLLTTTTAASAPAPTAVPTTLRTTTPIPTPLPISEATLNARIVDARNQLNNLIDSDVADTIITHPGGSQDCEVKMSRELGYLIDANTGESTFIKGDYWSIDAGLFSNPMSREHEYIIIHTHPRMWTTCRTTTITSLYSFSIGDLEGTANLTGQGYHVRTLIAISDKEYRIAPKISDNWKSGDEIQQAINRIEWRMGSRYSYFDPILNQEFYDVDNLMPFLARELNYTYSVNSNVIT
jgi:hypothetical protein